MRILVAEPGYSQAALALLRTLGEVAYVPERTADIRALVADADVLVVRLAHRVTRDVFDAAPRLKVVATSTTGLDHIDVAEAGRRGVAVLSLRGEVAFLRTVRATPEHTFALLLALLRRIPAAAAAVHAGRWEQDPFQGRELSGKTLGIVGIGRVGTAVAGIARGFGMRCLAYDPHLSAEDITVRGAEPVAFDALLAASDVVSMHVPLADDTVGLLSRERIARLKSGAIVVNTARGRVIDEAALVEALASGAVAGAALDVLAAEEGSGAGTSPLVAYARDHDHVLITPHIAGTTAESLEKTQVFIAQKVIDHCKKNAL
ncbi:hypothetical protein EPO33_02660 [Patescibacteria group bacterium]|nr:MAG: hypothetical protein EPO33_02660 [Patescibacteria group bacterium]